MKAGRWFPEGYDEDLAVRTDMDRMGDATRVSVWNEKVSVRWNLPVKRRLEHSLPILIHCAALEPFPDRVRLGSEHTVGIQPVGDVLIAYLPHFAVRGAERVGTRTMHGRRESKLDRPMASSRGSSEAGRSHRAA